MNFNMYECHLTYEVAPEQAKILELFAKETGWKTSFIDGDPILGSGVRFFLTAHNKDVYKLYEKMKKAVDSGPMQPIREKIEMIVHDTKTGKQLYLPMDS